MEKKKYLMVMLAKRFLIPSGRRIFRVVTYKDKKDWFIVTREES